MAATDFSVFGNHAVNRAALIAREFGADLNLMHAVTPAALENLVSVAVRTDPDQGGLDAARETLQQIGTVILERHGIASNVQVASGPPLQALASHADTLPADLVVLGVRGASPMRHLLLGSTAERLAGKVHCPVLVVKQPPREEYRSLLVAVDFSASSLQALLAARAIAPKADISLLHVFDTPFEGKLRYAGVDDEEIHYYRLSVRQDAMHKLEALCEEARIPAQDVNLIAIHGSPAPNILEQQKMQDCDLIVMGKRHKNVLEELMLGSVIRQVMAESLCDVLISV